MMVELVQPMIVEDASPTSSLTCPQCPKQFTSQKLMHQHQQMFHTDKSFICEICGKAFRFRSNLAEHRSVHTALKPYVCKFCGKSSRLKGNLTKHILKHHKKEQAEQVGKDDIIIKKDPRRFIKKPPQVAGPTQNGHGNPTVSPVPGLDLGGITSFLPKEEKSDPDYERAIFLSFGLDQGSMDLSGSPDNDSSENGTECANGGNDIDSELSATSPLPLTTVGGATSLQALLAQVTASACSTPPPRSSVSTPALSSSSSTLTPVAAAAPGGPHAAKTQCNECGKHFRKGSALQLHMTLNHGFPPPGSSISSCDEKNSEGEPESEMSVLRSDICAVKAAAAGDLSVEHRLAKIEQTVATMDARMAKMEKNVDTVLNSMYSLVQLQTGLNSSVTRFRDDASDQFRQVKAMIHAMSSQLNGS